MRKGKLMSLLERIAYSNGDPQRALTAVRLINQRLAYELSRNVDSEGLPRRLIGKKPAQRSRAQAKRSLPETRQPG
jgi:hypothetical protein